MTATPQHTRVGHVCHVPACSTPCPPAYLTCAPHWRNVPKELQDEVYRTFRARSKGIDATWGAWWRAQAHAIHAAMLADERIVEAKGVEWIGAWLAREVKKAEDFDARARS